jgi:hypothetical protein
MKNRRPTGKSYNATAEVPRFARSRRISPAVRATIRLRNTPVGWHAYCSRLWSRRPQHQGSTMAARPLWKGQLRLSLVAMAVEKKSTRFDISRFKDNYTVAMRELIERKTGSKGAKKVSTDEDEERPATGDNVIDLMAALKKSLEKTSGGAGGKSKGRKTAAKKQSKKKKTAGRKRKRA